MNLQGAIDYFQPAGAVQQEPDVYRRIRLSIALALGSSFLGITYSPLFYFGFHNIFAALACLVVIATCLASAARFRLHGNLTVFAHTVVATICFVHTVNCWTTGGVNSVMAPGYLIMPLMGTVLLGKRGGMIWSGISLGFLVALAAVEWGGYTFPVIYPPEMATLANLVLSATVILVGMLFVLLLQFGLDETVQQLAQALGKSDELLLNILPSPIADRLKRGERDLADYFPNITVLFADIVDFTATTQRMPPTLVVNRLNTIFKEFDAMAGRYGLEKIKTIGDCYMVVGGLPEPCEDHVEKVAEMAFDIQQRLAYLSLDGEQPLQMRIGVHTGEAVAGVIGTAKFIYDLWGDTVNTASRMEALGEPGKIQCTEAVFEKLNGRYCFEYRGEIDVRGKGRIPSYFLTRRNMPKAPSGADSMPP
jgi:class 3 adenylate cyclase